jgi:hypothetical protein
MHFDVAIPRSRPNYPKIDVDRGGSGVRPSGLKDRPSSTRGRHGLKPSRSCVVALPSIFRPSTIIVTGLHSD